MKTFVLIIILILSIIITQKVNRIISSHILAETFEHAGGRVLAIWVITVTCLGALANKVGLLDLNNKKTSDNQSSVQVQEYKSDRSVENQYAGAKQYFQDNERDVDEETDYDEDVDYEEEDYEEENNEEEYDEEEYDEKDANEETQEYIFPESDTRVLTAEEIKKYDSDVLRIARNEIYARHGRRFDDPVLQEYFNSLSWYEGTIAADNFDESVLNSIEKKNLKKIVKYE